MQNLGQSPQTSLVHPLCFKHSLRRSDVHFFFYACLEKFASHVQYLRSCFQTLDIHHRIERTVTTSLIRSLITSDLHDPTNPTISPPTSLSIIILLNFIPSNFMQSIIRFSFLYILSLHSFSSIIPGLSFEYQCTLLFPSLSVMTQLSISSEPFRTIHYTSLIENLSSISDFLKIEPCDSPSAHFFFTIIDCLSHSFPICVYTFIELTLSQEIRYFIQNLRQSPYPFD